MESHSEMLWKNKKRNSLQNEINRLRNVKREISKIPEKDRSFEEDKFMKAVDESIESLSRELMEL